MEREEKLLLQIIRYAICGTDFECFEVDFNKFVNLCVKQDLLILVYTSCKNKGIYQEEFSKYTINARNKILNQAYLESSTENLLELFEKNGILVVPIKGYNVKKFYPNKDFRESADFDCFVREEDLDKIKKLLSGTEFTQTGETGRHLCVKSKLGNFAEIHTELFSRYLGKYFKDEILNSQLRFSGKQNVVKLTDNQEYLISISHMASHYIHEGVGVRYLIDLYLLNKKMDLDRESLQAELIKCGLAKFNECMLKVCGVIFDGEEADEFDTLVLENMLKSSPLGDITKRGLGDLARSYDGNAKSSKRKAFFRKIYPCKQDMIGLYPNLKKRPYLLCFYHIKRHFTILFRRKKSVKSRFEHSEEDIKQAKYILEKLGL